jgi:hypothetical protein
VTTQLPTWHGEPPPPDRSTPADRSTPPFPGHTGATSSDLVPAAPGATVGERYLLRAAIGHGGMGTVWRAVDTLLRRDVAVKEVVLPRDLAIGERDALYQRTMREARAAAALSHPAVVQVYDVVTDGDRPWIVMELLQARSLAEMIMEDGPLAPRAVAKIGIALLGALEVAHAAGVLHRDVKPANVLICSDGRCVLSDFGVARLASDVQLTKPGMVLGSPHFISPERAIGAAFGPPSDLFSLGVTLYTAVEGRPPFDKPGPFETMRAVVEEEPAAAVRAGPLTGVLFGLLEKDPARRWNVPTARGVLRDLLNAALASQAAPTHETDPYAVVRPASYTPAPSASPPPTGQIGGRAMIGPGESLTGAVRRIKAGAGADQAAPAAGGVQTVGPGLPSQRGPAAPARSGPPRHRRSWGSSSDHAVGVPNQRGGPDTPGGGAPPTLGGAVEKLRGLSSRTRLVLAVAATLVIVLGAVALANLGRSGQAGNAAAATPTTERPLIDVQEYRDTTRGFHLNVPHTWTKRPANSYVDFIDPADPNGRYLRVNVESAGGDSRQFMQVVERNLSAPNKCLTPYQTVATRDVQLSGRAAAELEYTCGQGEKMRHGIWRATVVDGKSYHFFLTVPDSQFTDSKVIFDEMVRSFRFDV